MRRFVSILVFSSLVAAGGMASASPEALLAARRPEKAPAEYPPNLPDPHRQGGDTVLDAFFVASFPFESTGTTTGYVDDYDEVCPYDTPGSPDVVYTFIPDDDIEIDVDMLGSTYDTKIYIYDENLALIACNDDFYSDFVSKLVAVALAGGVQYFLVIDGYGGDHGEYALAITGFEPPPPCRVIPPCGAPLEEEPPLEDGYIDVCNGGCNSEEYGAPFTDLPYPDVYYGTEFSGTLGWYLGPTGEEFRDTDWLRTIYPYEGGEFEVEFEAAYPSRLFWISGADCDNYEIEQYIDVEACERVSMWVSGPGGEEVWFVVAPQVFEPPPGYPGGEYRYRMSLGGGLGGSCLELGPQSDYSFGCAGLLVEHHYTAFGTADCAHDLDFQQLCGTEPTPGGDVFASVYLEAGGHVSFAWYPYYIKSQPPRSSVCMALVSDLRLDSKSCADVVCFSNYNDFGGLEAPETGWYWLVIDDVSEDGSFEYGNIWSDRVEPPTPPDHDGCEGAEPLPPGDFAFDDDLTNATNRFDPGRDGCPGSPEVAYTGRDVVYEVALAHGQTLDVTMSAVGDWSEVLYLVRDCEAPVDACVAAAEHEGGGVRLRYTALDDELLWLVCDSHGLGPRSFTLSGSIDTTTDGPPGVPSALAVTAAPNPFNPATRIGYTVPREGTVRLRVYGLDGRVLRTLVDAGRPAGRHETAWDGRDGHGRRLASGAYVVRLEAGGAVASARVLLLK